MAIDTRGQRDGDLLLVKGGQKIIVSKPGGFVTSVGLAMPAEFSVSGSPVTGNSTITVNKANETANTVWAGPTSGGAAAPTFRGLVTADIPAGVVTTTGSPLAGQVLSYNSPDASSNWAPAWSSLWCMSWFMSGGAATAFGVGCDNAVLLGTGTVVTVTSTNPIGMKTSGANNTTTAGAGLQHSSLAQKTVTLGILKRLRFRMALGQTTNQRVWVGLGDVVALADNSTSVYNASIPAANFVGFRYSSVDDGSTNWRRVAQTDATHQSINDTSIAINTSAHNFDILWDGTTLTFYIDGVSAGTLTTNIPTSGIVLSPMCILQNQLGTTQFITIYSMKAVFGEF